MCHFTALRTTNGRLGKQCTKNTQFEILGSSCPLKEQQIALVRNGDLRNHDDGSNNLMAASIRGSSGRAKKRYNGSGVFDSTPSVFTPPRSEGANQIRPTQAPVQLNNEIYSSSSGEHCAP
ncbi:hypothetical protein KIN20_034888 [Parelaphostrongylus tenuis]|uniref:Uncharacterized protein n=1 Tax=Parelaphostrongylus tenuis TaxID=148309 RepID=A0AAD5WJB3_PARTN|nr:hypothetical protein KIN20_034888 [Parelaphostrongylus tenuis]